MKNAPKIWDIVALEEKAFEEKVDLNPSYAQNQKQIIKLIEYYWMSRYQSGNNDSSGFKKAFFNIVENPVQVAAKQTDLDTKDIKIIAENGKSYYPAWIMEKMLKQWMKRTKNFNGKTFGQFLNEIIYNLPKYGHLIVKKVGDTVHLVPLKNIINNQTAYSILKSDLVIEKHEYTPAQLRAQNWDKGKIERAIANRCNDGIIEVYEVIAQDGYFEDNEYNYYILPKAGKNDEIFYSAKMDIEDLYKEVVWERIDGRAMGKGQVEKLFENQIAKNQTENFLRSGMRWSSKHIFQSRDDSIGKNLVTDIENGEILSVLSEVTPVAVEERNMHAYGYADQKWDGNTMSKTFSHEQMSGERPPSGTPFGTTKLQTMQAGMYFDMKREDIGLFLKDLLFDWILKTFKKSIKNTKNLMLGEFDDQELEKLRGLVLANRTKKEQLRYWTKTGKLPDSNQIEIIRATENEKLKKAKEIKLPKDYLENIEISMDIIITNEQIDVAAKLTTMQTILQIIGSNPAVFQDPRLKRIVYKMMDLAGFSPVDFGMDDDTGLQEAVQAQVGGSIARPTPQQGPVQGAQTQRL